MLFPKVISREYTSTEPIITPTREGCRWTVFASKPTVIFAEGKELCPTGLRIYIPKGIVGHWVSHAYEGQPPRYRPIKHSLNHEDTGSSLKILLKNRTSEVCYVEQGEPIAVINFEEGQYYQTTLPSVDVPWTAPYVCRLSPTARKPELVCEMFGCGKGTTTQWQMFSDEDVTIPPLEDRLIRTGAGFAFHPNLIGKWIEYPTIRTWAPTVQTFKTDDHCENPYKTAKVRIQNRSRETITIRARSTVAILEFKSRTDIEVYDPKPEMKVCSIEPGATLTRSNPQANWRVHPMKTEKIEPQGKKTIPIGVTFHTPEGHTAIWDLISEQKGLLLVTHTYIKDPEIVVKNDSEDPIVVNPWNPIAQIKSVPELEN